MDKGVFGFPLFMYSKSMFVSLDMIYKKIGLHLGVFFVLSHEFFLYIITRVIRVFWYFHINLLIFLIIKVVKACWAHTDKWVTSVSFKRCVWCHLVAKLDLLSSPWMCNCVLFYMVWHVTTYSGQIDDCFFFFYLLLGKMHDFPSFFQFQSSFF